MKHRPSDIMTLKLMAFYLVIIMCISYVACYFAYQQQFEQLRNEADMALLRVVNEYENATEDFWDIYIPIFHSRRQGTTLLNDYFMEENSLEFSPLERVELMNLLSQMAIRDDRIRWIAVVRASRSVNYAYNAETGRLITLPEDFPYWDEIAHKSSVLEIYGESDGTWLNSSCHTFAMSGADSRGNPSNSIVVGYDTTYLRQICVGPHDLPSIQFDIVLDDRLIFSSGSRGIELTDNIAPGTEGVIPQNGESYYISVSEHSPRAARIYYTVDYWELFFRAHRNTPLLLLVVALLAAFSWVLYLLVSRSLMREMGIIQNGLKELGENHLNYRIQADLRYEDLRQIAGDINVMAQSLKENIERASYYELRQREAEMQELQAKFNPHFLYNSLEMFRSKCLQNGDDETADLIAQTAAIFRGFINPRKFIPIQEELAFSKRYLALFRARYSDSVQILYDIDTEVLQYGIIRNVFQPLIENYFVHGFDNGRSDNYIRFGGYVLNEDTIIMTVSDNGVGVSQERLENINRTLAEPITAEESYGLKNLNQRLHLFYGEPYGLRLRANDSGGLTLEMAIARWTVEDGERHVPGRQA